MNLLATRLTNLTDARYFAAKEVEFMAFCLEEGADGYLDPMLVKAIREWVQGPAILGEFMEFSAESVRETCTFLGLDGAVVGPLFTRKDLEKLAGLRVFREIEVGPTQAEIAILNQLENEWPLVEAFVLNFNWPNFSYSALRAGILWSPDFLKELTARFPIFLKMNFEPPFLADLMDWLKPAGLVLSGSDEVKTGLKLFDEIEDLMEILGR